MGFKVNMQQLPVKAHYFFFMSAMGPILPFLPVYGKELGIPSPIMGTISAILPILYLVSKPIFGYVVDFFKNQRKMIFIGILICSSLSFVLLYFLPQPHPYPGTFNETSTDTQLNSCYHNKFCNQQNVSGSSCQLNGTVWIPNDACLYKSSTFWIFVLLMSLGSIGFNVTNSLSDAICFDVLGEGGHAGYGRQRVWGTIGFGIAAFLAGYLMNLFSKDLTTNSYTPAFILVIGFTTFDVICCTKLELPIRSESENIAKDVLALLRRKTIAIFLVFATIVGMIDGFIIYFLFWYVEDLALSTDHFGQIKLIEGLIIAAETLGGEVIFFSFSGKIIKKFGYGYSMTFCFICYSLRLALISVAPNPWWIVLVELMMQGPTYALCYTIIVSFASVVAPPGTSSTVQGIIAGMDDGFGFALGSLISGIFYERFGGKLTMRIFSSLGAVSAVAYLIVYLTILKPKMPNTKSKTRNDEMIDNMNYESPMVAVKQCQTP